MTTIRHTECSLLIESACSRCIKCSSYRKTLQTFQSQLVHQSSQTADKTAPDSHVNYRYLSTPDKHDRLQRLHNLQRCTKIKLERIRQKLALAIEEGSVEVDETIHYDVQDIATSKTQDVTAAFPEDSFQRLFWEQQMAARDKKNPRSMRWHPLMIKWCLYLRYVSGKSYEILRDSGCIKLPSKRTLRDYTHCITATSGFSSDVDRYLLKLLSIRDFQDFQKNFALIMDEMYIKEDLVYNKVTGALVGFANLGDINSHLLQFQCSLDSNKKQEKLAKTMIVFMVRGLFSDFKFPYVQFPCAELTGDLLFDPLWEAVERLERYGLRVLAVTADGGSPNRRLFKIHNTTSNSEIMYKVKNPFGDGRSVRFFSDYPHLIKTVRNCLASTKRNLWVSLIIIIPIFCFACSNVQT